MLAPCLIRAAKSSVILMIRARPCAHSCFFSTFLPSTRTDCFLPAPVCDCVTDGVPLTPAPMLIDCALLRPLWFCEMLPPPSALTDCVLPEPSVCVESTFLPFFASFFFAAGLLPSVLPMLIDCELL